jgi:transketolase
MLNDIADEMRKRILKLAYRGRSGHIATSLSSTDILVELYFDNILRYDAKNPAWTERDRFVLSKGHASLLLYNILAKAGYFQFSDLESYCQPGTKFGSHPTIAIPGVEASTGALGHGYSYAVGLALAAKMDTADYLVYALLGDGECQEGSIWEAAATTVHYNLANLITIVDMNGLQASDYVQHIMSMGDFRKRWEAYGFEVLEIDGHNLSEIKNALLVDRSKLPPRPLVILAHTIKGKGIPMIENNPEWHSRIPKEEELCEMLVEMGMTREEFENL